MTQDTKGFGVLIVLLGIVLVGSIGFAGWRVHQSSQEEKKPANTATKEIKETKEAQETGECAAITAHRDRHDCYLSDENRQLLETAIETNDPSLCAEVDHVFVPHDVHKDIERGIIGTLTEGEKAIASCEQAVKSGRVPGV